VALEIVEPRSPEHPVTREPAIDVRKRSWIQRVDPRLALAPFAYQPRLTQDAKMPGDRRPADRKTRGELAGCQILAAQGIEDVSASRIGDRAERVSAAGANLSNHSVTY
jgi:hypothetical protein